MPPGERARSVTDVTAVRTLVNLATYHYSLSVLSSLNGKLDEAVAEMEKALAFDAQSVFLATELAGLYSEKGNLPKAIAICEKTLAKNGRDIDVRLLLANLYLNARNFENALREYLKVIELEPRNTDALLYTGILYGEAKNYEKAVSTFRLLLTIDPDHLMGNYYLAKTLSEGQQYAAAAEIYTKTLALKPGFEPAVLDLGRLFEKQEKNDQAVEQYRAYLKINPHSVNVRLKLADLLLKLNKPEEAEQELRETPTRGNGSREIAYRLSLYYLENDRYARAAEIILELLNNSPNDYRLRYLLGSAYEGQKDYQQASAELRKIPREAELFPTAQASISLMLKKTGQIEAAIANLSAAIDVRKDAPDLYALLSSLYEEKKELLKAEEILKMGLQVSPSVMLHFSLGVLYEKTDRFPESIKEMETVLQMDSKNAEAMNFIGYTYADRGIKLAEAEDLIRKALALKPGNAYMLDSLGWVCFRQ
ncbi:MAG: tetratricopeptide repeat protein, partial [Deltaproteobacteria bacterium]|nr:tetratricopeptide repeat protein [Deltaproteobacteria bacterium]